jgi:plastocyanin
MRRVFTLLLLTPLVASCAESATPVAPAGATLTEGATEEAWPAEENWFTPGDVLTLADDEMSAQAVGTAAASPSGAVMQVGNADVGSPYPTTHDGSFHANDRIIPGTAVINAGETVTFKMVPGHRLAVYDAGVHPKDIQPNPGPLLLYPVGRLYLQPRPTAEIKLKFAKPGRYLVLCAINKHFFVANMWGWVQVK